MKKILSIALALVMVLSMGAAFASPCTGGFDWTRVTGTNCGQGSIEVIPYVKVNDGCGGYNWVVNECAAAVASENVYFAIRLTVEEWPDPEWWAEATVEVALDGDTERGDDDRAAFPLVPAANSLVVDDSDANSLFREADGDVADIDSQTAASVWYFNWRAGVFHRIGTGAANIDMEDVENNDTTAITLNNNVDDYGLVPTGSDYIVGMRVLDAANAEVCATLAADGETFTEGIVGDYYVYVGYSTPGAAIPATPPGTWTGGLDANGDGLILVYEEELLAGAPAVNNDGSIDITNAIAAYEVRENEVFEVRRGGVDDCSPYTYRDATAFFGLYEDTDATQDLIDANFGFDDEVEDCFAWGSAATAIVDVNCEIEIPKTGDVSVVAYAVMALVTAAGALKFRK